MQSALMDLPRRTIGGTEPMLMRRRLCSSWRVEAGTTLPIVMLPFPLLHPPKWLSTGEERPRALRKIQPHPDH